MIQIEQITKDLDSLPEEAQTLLIDFIQLLKKNYISTEVNTSDMVLLDDIEDEPFVGMWKEREDMTDSSQWVREVRKQEWGN